MSQSVYIKLCVFIVLSIFVYSSGSWASIQYKKTDQDKSGKFIRNGIFAGGIKSSLMMTFFDIRNHYSKLEKTERLVFELGDGRGLPLFEPSNSFYVTLEDGGKTILVEFSQMNRRSGYENKIERLLENSELIEAVNFTSGFSETTMGVRMSLKKPVAMEVFELPSGKVPSRIVIDMKVLE